MASRDATSVSPIDGSDCEAQLLLYCLKGAMVEKPLQATALPRLWMLYTLGGWRGTILGADRRRQSSSCQVILPGCITELRMLHLSYLSHRTVESRSLKTQRKRRLL